MEPTKDELRDRLITAVENLPPDKVYEVLDFADYLQRKYGRARPERGSAEAVLQALERAGPLEFKAGELDVLPAEIEELRDLDLKADE